MQENQKKILITGTSSGIGEFLAQKFIDDRCMVIGIARKKATINNKNYFHYITDINNENNLKRIFHNIKNKFNFIDTVVNNGGSTSDAYKFSSFEENIKDKTIFDRGEKLFFGIVTLLACISAGISGYAGLVGLLTFLGAGALISPGSSIRLFAIRWLIA